MRVENIKSVSEPRFYKNNNESAAKRSLNFEPVSSKLSMHSSTEFDTNKKPLMSNAEFQAFVISSLSKLKFEISNMSSTIHANYISSEAFYKNVGHSTSLNLSNNIQQSVDISEIFPINTEDQLKKFDDKLKSNNDFKLNVMAKLSLFVGIKNVGDSVRRLMSRMFSDELLQNYSLLGFKKKNRFSNFLVYRLILDVIRVQPKFSSTLDKEIDVPISTWLSHAKFRIKDKKI